MVGMTGSSATGKKIMAACADGLKRLVLELGGKDPMVVFADADLEVAAADAVNNSVYNCGQVIIIIIIVMVAAACQFKAGALCCARTLAGVLLSRAGLCRRGGAARVRGRLRQARG